MSDVYLLPETVAVGDGAGPVVAVETIGAKTRLYLEITRAPERGALEVAIWGSADGVEWGDRPLIQFPQKFYCGRYAVDVDLSEAPAIHHLKVTWRMSCWADAQKRSPLFGFLVASANSMAMAAA
jgi:hypothetical protein